MERLEAMNKEEFKKIESDILDLDRRVRELERFDDRQKKLRKWLIDHWWQTLLIGTAAISVFSEIVHKIKGFM